MSTSDGPGQGGLIPSHELAQKLPQFAAEFTDETGRQKRNEAAESTPSIAPNLGVHTPQIQESPACTTNGVGARKGKSPHSFLIGKRRRTPANVPMLIGRISANHQKVLAAPQVAMPCPGWQHGNVTGLHRDFAAAFSAQHQARMASRKSENLVRRGVVVVKIVDAIAPLRRPAVSLKSLLENQGWIGPRGLKGAMIDHNREALVVGHPLVA